jgi:hypothetical protein
MAWQAPAGHAEQVGGAGHTGHTGHTGIALAADISAAAFARSAAIERIVVFYRDKTFSEYQPETARP